MIGLLKSLAVKTFSKKEEEMMHFASELLHVHFAL